MEYGGKRWEVEAEKGESKGHGEEAGDAVKARDDERSKNWRGS